jgi:hypothetical protein
MTGAPEYLAARRALLDALEALSEHIDSIVVVGAQAVYLHTGAAELAVAEFTTDADLALDPDGLGSDPRLDAALAARGFAPDDAQPGIYWSADRIEVDLMVPETLGGAGRRGARLGPHGNRAARKARGLEAALVDQRGFVLQALAPDDDRAIEVRVAGVAALLVAKAHKLGERMERAPKRMEPKDALDVLRLLRASETDELAETFRQLLADVRAGGVTREALDYFQALYTGADAPGLGLVRDAVAGLEDPAVIGASMQTLAEDLLRAVGSR